MKKSILALASVLLLTLATGTYLQAQQMGRCMGPENCMFNRGCPDFLPPHVTMMKKELNLSDEQVEKTLNLDSQYVYKLYRARENRDMIEALITERRAEFQKILSTDQKAKYKKLMEKFREMKKEMEKEREKERTRETPPYPGF